MDTMQTYYSKEHACESKRKKPRHEKSIVQRIKEK